MPEIDLVVDGVRTSAWQSTKIASKVKYEREITYQNRNVVQLGDGSYVCFRINLSGLDLLEMAYRSSASDCGIYINNTKDPDSATNPSIGAIASTPLSYYGWTTATLDVSALDGFNNIYITSQAGWSVYISSLSIK